MAQPRSRGSGEPAATTDQVSRYISSVIRWRRWVLFVWIAAVGASTFAYLLIFASITRSGIWFLEGDPELEAYRSYNSEFGELEWTYLWLRADSVFSPEFLRDLSLLSERIEALENVERVRSLTGAGEIVLAADGTPSFEKYFSVPSGELPKQEQAGALRQRDPGKPAIRRRLVPREDEQYTILAIQNRNHLDSIEPYRIRLIDEIREAIAAFPTVLDSGIVGTTVINAELNRAAKRDMFIYYALIAVFVVIGGGLAVGRLR